jgi:hypothetical protein
MLVDIFQLVSMCSTPDPHGRLHETLRAIGVPESGGFINEQTIEQLSEMCQVAPQLPHMINGLPRWAQEAIVETVRWSDRMSLSQLRELVNVGLRRRKKRRQVP